MYADLLEKLHVPGLVRGGGEEKTNCDSIDLKSRVAREVRLKIPKD